MKPVKILFCTVLAGAMALAASRASAQFQYPFVKLSISGTLTCADGGAINYGTVTQGFPLQKVSATSQNLINLLNSSPTFVAALVEQFGPNTNQVPAGSYFVWDIWDSKLIITNKNGFVFNLNNNAATTDFGSLELDDNVLIGTFSQNDTTLAGSETDQTGIYLFFNDHNGNEIEVYGLCILTWTYAAKSGANQQTTLSVSLAGEGFSAVVSGNSGVAEFTATGSATATDGIDQNPFFSSY